MNGPLALALSLFLSLLEDRSFERLNNVALEITATKQGHAPGQCRKSAQQPKTDKRNLKHVLGGTLTIHAGSWEHTSSALPGETVVMEEIQHQLFYRDEKIT